MSESHIILCPGQGAQRLGMGKAWFDAFPAAAQTFGAADRILGDSLGDPLSTLCFAGPASTLDRTDVAQPALFTCAIACYQSLLGKMQIRLTATAGLSLGEYSALHLAGAISFEDGLRLVALRGRAMQDAAGAIESGMVALIGADEAHALDLCRRVTAGRDDLVLVPANFNAPGQIVLSGHAEACDRAVEEAGHSGFRATKLAVAGAFHSPLMQPAADRLAAALASVDIRPPCCPTLSNVTGQPHGARAVTEEESPDPTALGAESRHDGSDGAPPPAADENDIAESIRRNLVAQLTSPVRWDACCQWLARNTSSAYHELAPGKVLAGLMRRIDRSIKVTSHDEPN